MSFRTGCRHQNYRSHRLAVAEVVAAVPVGSRLAAALDFVAALGVVAVRAGAVEVAIDRSRLDRNHLG